VRRLKLVCLWALKTVGVFALSRWLTRHRVRILCYHGSWRIQDGSFGDALFISPKAFEKRLELLRRWGYSVMDLDEALAGLTGRGKLPDSPVIITIDDGWYGTFADMAPALERHGLPATIYCDTENLLAGEPIPHVMARYLRRLHCDGAPVSDEAERAFAAATDLRLSRSDRLAALEDFAKLEKIEVEPYRRSRAFAYMSPAELRELATQGFRVELHTHRHTLQDFKPDQISREIADNRQALARILGREAESFRHFCYPSGETANGVTAVLDRLGIASATTLEPFMAAPGGHPLLLPRLLDGGHMSSIEFEAELCGLAGFLRRLRKNTRHTSRLGSAM
jgi:peptidoglycan/xylan/chitin deacetylase (PgdA/CDA1 family)